MIFTRYFAPNDGKLHINGPLQIAYTDWDTYVPANYELIYYDNEFYLDNSLYSSTDRQHLSNRGDLLLGDGNSTVLELLNKDWSINIGTTSNNIINYGKGGILSRMERIEKKLYLIEQRLTALETAAGISGGTVQQS